MYLYLAVALGGSIGALARFSIMNLIGRWNPDTFPWSTLTVNIIGALMLGALIEVMSLVWSPSQEVRAFLVVGILGALTTFSTFTLDIFVLWERGYWVLGIVYAFSSCFLCLLSMWTAMKLLRMILS